MARTPQQIYRKTPKRLPEELKWSNYGLDFNPALLQYLHIPHHASITFTNEDFYVEAWVKLNAGFPNATLVSKTKYGTDGWYIIIYAAGRVLYVQMEPGAVITETSATAVTAGRWHHLFVGKTGGRGYIYVNGIDRTTVQPALGNIIVNARNMNIGRYEDLANQHFDGMIDEFGITVGVMTANLARRSFYRGYARREADSRLLLRMEDRAGLTAVDDSGYGNNGSLLPVLTPPTWIDVQKYQLLAEAGV